MDFDKLPEEVCLPNYDESILNLSCSILQHYGIKPKHPTLYSIDRLLAKNPKHVVLILLDGLGMNILESNLYYNDFLRRNLTAEYSSVFPPTTTASTTTLLSGLSPIEHGWLGWDVYFEQEDKTVTCFDNFIRGTKEPAADYHIAGKYLPYKDIITAINEAGTAKANKIFPFGPDAPKDLQEWIDAIRKSTKTNETTFTYAYWENPDHMLHAKGTRSNDVKKYIEELNQEMAYLCQECKDTTFIITADHGHKDVINHYICDDYPDIRDMLIRETSIEPRAISFFVKPECVKEFPRIFNDYFGNDYVLFTKEEIMQNQLFGPGFPNDNLTGIGDYIAAAYGSNTLYWKRNNKDFKSHHAGLSKEEISIPLITYEYKKSNAGLAVYYMIIGMFIFALLTIIL